MSRGPVLAISPIWQTRSFQKRNLCKTSDIILKYWLLLWIRYGSWESPTDSFKLIKSLILSIRTTGRRFWNWWKSMTNSICSCSPKTKLPFMRIELKKQFSTWRWTLVFFQNLRKRYCTPASTRTCSDYSSIDFTQLLSWCKKYRDLRTLNISHDFMVFYYQTSLSWHFGQ